MTFRNRPTLDRKHRPRWQDERHTQQLIIAGFAAAIAVALGIFGASVWGTYHDVHQRQVALVGSQHYTRDDLNRRTGILAAELQSTAAELQSQLGGARDAIVQQQLSVIQDQISNLSANATTSLVDGAWSDEHAADYGISVSEQEIDAEVARRTSNPERLRLSAVIINARPQGTGKDVEPTEEQFATAQKEAQAALDRINGGEDFAAVATDVSDDITSGYKGDLGLVEADSQAYGELFAAARDAKVGDLIGPVKTSSGYAVLKLVERLEAGPNDLFNEILDASGVSDDAYRRYVRDELLDDKLKEYFKTEVVQNPGPQRRIAQIFVAAQQGIPVPQQRLRHILIQPIPGADDQSAATDEQWADALARAKSVREQLSADDADWTAVAAASSDDPGSRGRGGDLGWYDPASSQFDPQFQAGVVGLPEGELSEPIKTQFGYHIIEVYGHRISAEAEAADLVAQLRDDPGAFEELARTMSEDAATAKNGGVVGWVAPYQYDAAQDEAIFGLPGVNAISDPVQTANGWYIYKLLATTASREIDESRLSQIENNGFRRWFAEQKKGAEIWIDPEFAPAPATTTA